jgi:hypothetical protein
MPKHVKEAYRLLNKSIIRVDQPDIHLVSQLKNLFSFVIGASGKIRWWVFPCKLFQPSLMSAVEDERATLE